MKRYSTNLVVLFLSLYSFSFADSPVTVYTPNGSAVSAWIMTESSIATRTYLDADISQTYPNATLILTYDGFSSTRRFNCHGYAWYMSELSVPLSSPRWIGYYANNTDEHDYWLDGSYVQIPSNFYPAKVSWSAGDHSAVTTSVEGWFISKWNEYPLVRHRWDDTPFGNTSLKYYVDADLIVSATVKNSSTSQLIPGSINFYAFNGSTRFTYGNLGPPQNTSTISLPLGNYKLEAYIAPVGITSLLVSVNGGTPFVVSGSLSSGVVIGNYNVTNGFHIEVQPN